LAGGQPSVGCVITHRRGDGALSRTLQKANPVLKRSHGAPILPHARLPSKVTEPGFDLAVRTWTVERGLTLAVFRLNAHGALGTFGRGPIVPLLRPGEPDIVAVCVVTVSCNAARGFGQTPPRKKAGHADIAMPETEVKWPVFRGRNRWFAEAFRRRRANPTHDLTVRNCGAIVQGRLVAFLRGHGPCPA
jgi:hypothetical protein